MDCCATHSTEKRPIFIVLCLYRTAAAADGARYIKDIININDFFPFFFFYIILNMAICCTF
jgi:hypothetical protein